MAAKQRAAELLDDYPGWNFVVDLETTGLVDDGAYITEIAIADLTGRSVFAMRLDPQVPIPDAAAAISGLHSRADEVGAVTGFPTFTQVYPLLREVLLVDAAAGGGGWRLIGFNVEFERGIFRNELQRLGVGEEEILKWDLLEWHDVQPLLAEHQGSSDVRVPLQGGDHTALGDCWATIAALKTIAGRGEDPAPSRGVSVRKLNWVHDLLRRAEPHSKWTSLECAKAVVGRELHMDELTAREADLIIDILSPGGEDLISKVGQFRDLTLNRVHGSGPFKSDALAAIASDILGSPVPSVWSLTPQQLDEVIATIENDPVATTAQQVTLRNLSKSQETRLRNVLRGVFTECVNCRYAFMTRTLGRAIVSVGQLTEADAGQVFDAVVKQRGNLARKLPAWN